MVHAYETYSNNIHIKYVYNKDIISLHIRKVQNSTWKRIEKSPDIASLQKNT